MKWDDVIEAEIEAEKVEELKRKNILIQCKKLMSDEDYQDMLFTIEESDYTYNYEFVNEPVGNFQEDDNYWVNQTTNGGYTGDDFAGTLCFKVADSKYLKMHYSM